MSTKPISQVAYFHNGPTAGPDVNPVDQNTDTNNENAINNFDDSNDENINNENTKNDTNSNQSNSNFSENNSNNNFNDDNNDNNLPNPFHNNSNDNNENNSNDPSSLDKKEELAATGLADLPTELQFKLYEFSTPQTLLKLRSVSVHSKELVDDYVKHLIQSKRLVFKSNGDPVAGENCTLEEALKLWHNNIIVRVPQKLDPQQIVLTFDQLLFCGEPELEDEMRALTMQLFDIRIEHDELFRTELIVYVHEMLKQGRFYPGNGLEHLAGENITPAAALELWLKGKIVLKKD